MPIICSSSGEAPTSYVNKKKKKFIPDCILMKGTLFGVSWCIYLSKNERKKKMKNNHHHDHLMKVKSHLRVHLIFFHVHLHIKDELLWCIVLKCILIIEGIEEFYSRVWIKKISPRWVIYLFISSMHVSYLNLDMILCSRRQL